jgi:hypothetical protein
MPEWFKMRPGGQLGQSGEYWMGRRMSGLIRNSELQGGRPRLSWSRTGGLAPVSKSELCTGTYMIFCGPTNWVVSCVTEWDDTLSLYGCYTGYYRATHGVSTEAYSWKMALGWGRTRPDSLIMSWIEATYGALLACVFCAIRFIPL